MDRELLRTNWPEMKGRVRRRWNKLSEAELERVSGDAEELRVMLQERYGYTREEAKRELDHLIGRSTFPS